MAEIIAISKNNVPKTLGDVVFVHGLDGGVTDTWQIHGKADTFWPAWLADDLTSIAVWSLGYEASSSGWRGHALPLAERATNVLATLDSVSLGARPLVFIAHSLGGLVVKQALRRATEFGSPAAWVSIAKSTRGIIFLATPHQGSELASLVRRVARIVPGIRATPLIDDLCADSPQLRDLNAWYRSAAKHLGIQTQVYREGKTLGPTMIVGAASSDCGVEDVIPIPMDDDHISICKPASRTAMLYRRVLAFVAEAAKSPTAAAVSTAAAAQSGGLHVNPRILWIFISCPGDLAAERERVEATVRRVSSAFAAHAIHLATWRYDIDAIPSLGTDVQQAINAQIPESYDIYLGIMCRRVGTPTGRSASGTMEEFQSARDGWERERRPHVLFYFCKRGAPVSATPDELNQQNAVEDFRHRYPGLFASFADLDELAAQVERHLVALVLDLVLPSIKRPTVEGKVQSADVHKVHVPQRLKWVPEAAKAVDKATADRKGLFDYSSQRPSRIIAKIECLFDCDRLLTPIEREVLLASAHVRTVAVRNRPALLRAVVDAIPAAIGAAACEIAALSGAAPALVDTPSFNQGSVRLVTNASPAPALRSPLLVALLRLGELLDMDMAGLSALGRIAQIDGATPTSGERIEVFRAALMTHEIRVQLNVVTFVLAVASSQWIDLLKRCTSLRVEVERQSSRAILVRNGFIFAMASSEVMVLPAMQPPSGVWADLQSLGDSTFSRFRPLDHLGDAPDLNEPTAPLLAHLLPLPDSVTAGTMVVPLDPGDYDHVLVVGPISDGRPLNPPNCESRMRATAGEDCIVLESELLSGGGEFRWTLYRDYYDEYLNVQATGVLRLLDRRIAMMHSVEDQLGSNDRLPRLAAAQLWNDWLLAVWPALIDRTATAEETATAYGVLLAAFEQNERSGKNGQTRVDAYRNAVNWIENLLAHPNPSR